jgi:hypothetical protein
MHHREISEKVIKATTGGKKERVTSRLGQQLRGFQQE